MTVLDVYLAGPWLVMEYDDMWVNAACDAFNTAKKLDDLQLPVYAKRFYEQARSRLTVLGFSHTAQERLYASV